MDELENGRIYRIRSRNLVVGVWKAETRGFIGIREKFGSLYLFEEYHADTGPPLGTAREVEALDIVTGLELDEDNEALFELLKPYDEAINAELVEDARRAQIEAESKRMAPQTREEWEREQRVLAVREWWASLPREERLDGRKPLWNEYMQRLDKAIKGAES